MRISRLIFTAFTMAVFISCKSGQPLSPPDQPSEELGINPYYFVDGKESDSSILSTLQAEDVAVLTTYAKGEAVKKFGEKSFDGAVEIETKEFASEKYQNVFKNASREYKDRLHEHGNDNSFQYILNDSLLTGSHEGVLAVITPKLLKKITVLDKETLESRYGVTDKSVGVAINASPPKDLYNGKAKFNKKQP